MNLFRFPFGSGTTAACRTPRSPLAAASALVLAGLFVSALVGVSGCEDAADHAGPDSSISAGETAFIDTLQFRTFRYFWDLCNPHTGLAPDRWPTDSFASTAATGFALTAYPIGVERGYVSREAAVERTLKTLEFFWSSPQDTAASGATGYRGFYYHFLDPDTGVRFGDVELSTIDTALLLAGALFCQTYFDGPGADETRLRALADSLYLRVDWEWASIRPPVIGHGWKPEIGFLGYDWRGYNEAMLLYLLAMASPTHPAKPGAWEAWTEGYQWDEYYGRRHLGFPPLFGHQYTHVWFDLRGIRDDVMRANDLDYFENSRRAVLAQHDYALDNPGGFTGYGPRLWGLTACDGPVNQTFEMDGTSRAFVTYWARGASFAWVNDDGTVCPSAAAGSLPFAPEIVLPTLMAMKEDHGENLFAEYGFLDAVNPTFTLEVPVQHGRVVPGKGWYDTDYLGIDQGPILAMIENHRTGLIWKTMRRNPHVIRGLKAAGFSGGWLLSEEASHD